LWLFFCSTARCNIHQRLLSIKLFCWSFSLPNKFVVFFILSLFVVGLSSCVSIRIFELIFMPRFFVCFVHFCIFLFLACLCMYLFFVCLLLFLYSSIWIACFVCLFKSFVYFPILVNLLFIQRSIFSFYAICFLSFSIPSIFRTNYWLITQTTTRILTYTHSLTLFLTHSLTSSLHHSKTNKNRNQNAQMLPAILYHTAIKADCYL